MTTYYLGVQYEFFLIHTMPIVCVVWCVHIIVKPIHFRRSLESKSHKLKLNKQYILYSFNVFINRLNFWMVVKFISI